MHTTSLSKRNRNLEEVKTLRPLSIRKMDEKDIRSITAMERTIFPSPWSVRSITDILKGESYIKGIAAERNGNIIGYAFYWIISTESHIANIAVDEHHRRGKIGQQLLEFILADSLDNNVTHVVLEVRGSNVPAISLYEKFGFCRVGIRKNYYSDTNEDAILMIKYF